MTLDDILRHAPLYARLTLGVTFLTAVVVPLPAA